MVGPFSHPYAASNYTVAHYYWTRHCCAQVWWIPGISLWFAISYWSWTPGVRGSKAIRASMRRVNQRAGSKRWLKKEWLQCTKCSLKHNHALARTEQPSSMVMPLDMILACSKHASWSRGLLAFGLPSASNKLSQPDPSEVPSALEAEREREWKEEGEMKWNESK